MRMRRFLDIARIIGRKGLDGRMLIEPVAAFAPLFRGQSADQLVGMLFHFVPPRLDLPRDAVLASASSIDGQRAVVAFDGISDPDIAESLVGSHCLVVDDGRFAASSILDDVPFGEGEEASFDDMTGIPDGAFAGWRVIDATTGREFDVLDSECPAGQVLLHVTERTDPDRPAPSDASEAEEGQRHDEAAGLIPLADGLVVCLDRGSRAIVMELPNGLL